MPAPFDCPESTSWALLFAEALPPDQRERHERHLESCPACQARLDRTEADELLELARELGDPTVVPGDRTLAGVVDSLLREQGPNRTAQLEQPDLYFLRPGDRPDLLGLLGPYEVREVIGAGGMGVVLKAFEPALGRLVAIKVLAAALAGSATARRRFHREAQAAAAVCHEHVVAVHAVREADELPYLVMQYIPGESLQARLDRTGPLDVREIVRIGMQTASGLAAAHAQGLIHRDVKPANLLLENGLARVKITDFGLARMADDVGLTRDGVVAGTPEYMAPEQARGESVDHRADLFSLGSVLYALCTGRPPFRGSTALSVLRQVSDQAPAPIRSLNPEVPAWLETFIGRLMARDPAQRFQSATEVAGLLEGYLAHLQQPALVAAPELPCSAPALDQGRENMLPRITLRNGFLVAAALVMVLGLVGVFGSGMLASRKSPAIGPVQAVPTEVKLLEPKDGLVCLLVNKNSERCLSLAGKSEVPGADVVQGPMPERTGALERWVLIATGKAYRLRNEKTGLFLEITTVMPVKGARAVQGLDQPMKPNQQWIFDRVENGYIMRPGGSQLVLAIGARSHAEGAKAIQWEYLPTLEDQIWELWSPPTSAAGQAAAQPPAGKELDQEYYWSFKGEPENRQLLERIGPNAEQWVSFEPEGLRIHLPSGNPVEGRATGLAVRVPVKGDFEVSLNFEILKEPEPPDAGIYGTALTVLVNLRKAQWTATGCYRGVAANDRSHFAVWTTSGDENARDGNTRPDRYPTKAKTGRLRLVRTGSRVSWSVAEGAGTDFKLLKEDRLGGEEVDVIRITGATGGSGAELDARITDLRIKTGSGVDSATTGQWAETKGELPVAQLLGLGLLLLLLLGLGLWLYQRRRRRAQAQPAAPATAPPSVAFQCSTCGKNLKARADLVGKKVRCTQCGSAAVVKEPL
jgi:serine/threonine-protein kinase